MWLAHGTHAATEARQKLSQAQQRSGWHKKARRDAGLASIIPWCDARREDGGYGWTRTTDPIMRTDGLKHINRCKFTCRLKLFP